MGAPGAVFCSYPGVTSAKQASLRASHSHALRASSVPSWPGNVDQVVLAQDLKGPVRAICYGSIPCQQSSTSHQHFRDRTVILSRPDRWQHRVVLRCVNASFGNKSRPPPHLGFAVKESGTVGTFRQDSRPRFTPLAWGIGRSYVGIALAASKMVEDGGVHRLVGDTPENGWHVAAERGGMDHSVAVESVLSENGNGAAHAAHQAEGGAARLKEVEDEGGLVSVNVERLATNMRRISASIFVPTPLPFVCSVLTDYAHLGDFIPSLAVNQVLERRHRGAKLLQIGEENLALGLKFQARVVVEVEEVELKHLAQGVREVTFAMVEGDFQHFSGVWRMEAVSKPGGVRAAPLFTRLSYQVDVRPQVWLPVALVEGRIVREIGANLRSVRAEAMQRFGAVKVDMA